MASIFKRRGKYSVVYRYTDEEGKERQKWETFGTEKEAKARKRQVEQKIADHSFVVPTAKTLHDLLEEYLATYGVSTWAMSTYDGNAALIRNYVEPLIGDVKLSDLTPRFMDQYYRDLRNVKAIYCNNRKPKGEYVTPNTVREIHKVLRTAFNHAVRWGLMEHNPVDHAILPKVPKVERPVWDAEDLMKAMDNCKDDTLALAINLAFSCSLRIGEMLGLTWDCVDVSSEAVSSGEAYIYVNKELQRCMRDTLEKVDNKGVIYKFPPLIRSTHSVLLLKEPKTKTSVRKIYLPKTVAEMLIKTKQEQDNLKELVGDEYTDYNLVFAFNNGRPIEARNITKAFEKLIEDNDLPRVVFHSLRHSSISYKLKLTGGDIKAVQGDSGHAQVKMVTDVYSHVFEDDRVKNARLIEETFYSGRNGSTEAEPVDVKEPVPEQLEETDAEKLLKLLQKPEMAALVKTLASSL